MQWSLSSAVALYIDKRIVTVKKDLDAETKSYKYNGFSMANDFSYELEVRFLDCDSKKLKPVTRGVLQKDVLLEISQKSQENTCARVSFLIKLQASAL